MPRTRENPVLDLLTSLEVLTCSAQGCGIQFALPLDYVDRRRADHVKFYCPNGHSQYFAQETEEERLKRALAAAQGNLKWTQERLESEKKYAAAVERSRSAMRGVATRLRNKAKIGECAFCHQHFNDVALHMAEAHADVDPEQIEEESVEEGATS